jgi:hypothetical protein
MSPARFEKIPSDLAIVLRATVPESHALCDDDADPASSKRLLLAASPTWLSDQGPRQ